MYTGFANVVRNLTARWVNHFESIDIWGINFAGWPHDYPYRIFPAGYGDWTTAAKLTQFLNLLGNRESKYTHLWILQDCNQLSGGNVPEYLRKICDAAKVKITFYYPVDAPLEKEWLDCVAIADNAVTYTEYGYDETRKANPNVHPSILPHGVDTAVYHPLPNREELRRTQPLLEGWLEEDDFLIVNVNRNERRKSPQHSLQILRRLLDQGVKAKLVMHCPKLAVGEGTFLDVVGRQLGLPCGEHWKHNDSAFINWHGTYTEAQINELYNCADLVLNTAGGEGWGLSLSEGLAAGCRVAAPNHTSCGEIIRKVNDLGHTGRMFALPVSPQCQVNMCDNSRVRYPVDVVGAADMIAAISTFHRGSVPLNDAVKEWLSWDRIADEFIKIMLH